MKKIILFSFALVSSIASQSFAQFLPVKVAVPLTKAYIPQGFDSNDTAHIVVEGNLTNTCDVVGPIKLKSDTESKVILIEQSIYKFNRVHKETCIETKVPIKNIVKMNTLLPAGKYTVKSVIFNGAAVSWQKELGTLPIAEAKNEGPDNYLYAIMDSISQMPNERAVTLFGQLPGPCWILKEVKTLVESNDVITILPIIEYDTTINSICDIGTTVPFVKGVRLPSEVRGKVLIHVRSLNSQSINQIINL